MSRMCTATQEDSKRLWDVIASIPSLSPSVGGPAGTLLPSLAHHSSVSSSSAIQPQVAVLIAFDWQCGKVAAGLGCWPPDKG